MSSLALKLLSSLALLLGQKYAISVGAVVKVVKNKNEIGPHSSNPFGKSKLIGADDKNKLSFIFRTFTTLK